TLLGAFFDARKEAVWRRARTLISSRAGAVTVTGHCLFACHSDATNPDHAAISANTQRKTTSETMQHHRMRPTAFCYRGMQHPLHGATHANEPETLPNRRMRRESVRPQLVHGPLRTTQARPNTRRTVTET